MITTRFHRVTIIASISATSITIIYCLCAGGTNIVLATAILLLSLLKEKWQCVSTFWRSTIFKRKKNHNQNEMLWHSLFMSFQLSRIHVFWWDTLSVHLFSNASTLKPAFVFFGWSHDTVHGPAKTQKRVNSSKWTVFYILKNILLQRFQS